ncbi:MAG: BON domain-containing protein [Myxococcota bacterium]
MESAYLLIHLREQLAREAGELGIEVELVAGRLLLTGVVVSAERREHAERIARSMSNGHTVVNEIRVVPPAAAQEPEHLP